MKIAIDCRFWGLANTGFGRYTMRLITELARLDKHNQYYLLFRKPSLGDTITQPLFKNKDDNLYLKEELTRMKFVAPNFHPIALDASPYTLKEQLLLAKSLYQLKPDIYHAIDMNVPLLWFGKLIVTVHDLTRFQNINNQVTTLPLPIYWIKYLLSKFIIFKKALYGSTTIITPSNYVKQQLITNYQLPITKIHTTHEAPDEIYYQKIRNSKLEIRNLPKTYSLQPPYLIYTGTVYPHKNLPRLLEAIKLLATSYQLPATPSLAIACSRNIFRDRVENYAKQLGILDQVRFLGFVPDEDLRGLYRNSLAFITPSLSEGFGLPGLEAMAAGTLVLSSHVTCLPEIYTKHAIYFDPLNLQDITDKILSVLRMPKTKRTQLITQARKHSQTFSWQKLAQETLEIYQSI